MAHLDPTALKGVKFSSSILPSEERVVEMDAKEPAPAPPTNTSGDDPVRFDPSRMIGIIKRKALIKDLAAAYHAECLTLCQELLQLQRKWEEQQLAERRGLEDGRKQTMRPPKRQKKGL